MPEGAHEFNHRCCVCFAVAQLHNRLSLRRLQTLTVARNDGVRGSLSEHKAFDDGRECEAPIESEQHAHHATAHGRQLPFQLHETILSVLQKWRRAAPCACIAASIPAKRWTP